MNERDSEQVAHTLVARGYERVSCETEADVVLQYLQRARHRQSKRARQNGECSAAWRRAGRKPFFGFSAAMAQARGRSCEKQIPHLDLVVGTKNSSRGRLRRDLVAAKTRYF